jgi:uncharacterized coiled-coil protein SlyX
MPSRQRLIISIAAGFIFIAVGLSLVRGFGGATAEVPPSSVAHSTTVDQFLETAKALGITQQQAVDQLQVVQDELSAERAETKRLSEQIGALNEKLDALQQTVANFSAPPPHAAGQLPGPQPKPR